MNSQIRSAILVLVAALAPGSVSAALIFSDLFFSASTEAHTQLPPPVIDSNTEFIPNQGPGAVEALSRANGAPFPNLPNSVGSAFASAAQLTFAGGVILTGVGVNGFFLRNSLPPNKLLALAFNSQTITNNSTTDTESLLVSFFIPAPTMQFFGVGDSFPGGADLARDASALVEAELFTNLTRADGSRVQEIILTYGMQTFRDPRPGGAFSAIPRSSDSVGLTRFDEPDGSFGFALPELLLEDVLLPEIGPGESLEIVYTFSASASTGFGETGIFAAIGDPFNLSTSGARFNIQVGDPIDPGPGPGVPVPVPATWSLLAAGLLALRFRRYSAFAGRGASE